MALMISVRQVAGMIAISLQCLVAIICVVRMVVEFTQAPFLDLASAIERGVQFDVNYHEAFQQSDRFGSQLAFCTAETMNARTQVSLDWLGAAVREDRSQIGQILDHAHQQISLELQCAPVNAAAWLRLATIEAMEVQRVGPVTLDKLYLASQYAPAEDWLLGMRLVAYGNLYSTVGIGSERVAIGELLRQDLMRVLRLMRVDHLPPLYARISPEAKEEFRNLFTQVSTERQSELIQQFRWQGLGNPLTEQ